MEAEVFRTMMTQREHWSYPAIFGDGFSFTLPATAESLSMEADIDGQTIIFPLGPALMLSWATCDDGTNPDQGRIFRCTLRPGYRFQ
jgi:outer membrane translocation and assembly module TamA